MSDFAESRPGAGVTAVALIVVAFLELPVAVIVLAAFSKTAYLIGAFLMSPLQLVGRWHDEPQTF